MTWWQDPKPRANDEGNNFRIAGAGTAASISIVINHTTEHFVYQLHLILMVPAQLGSVSLSDLHHGWNLTPSYGNVGSENQCHLPI